MPRDTGRFEFDPESGYRRMSFPTNSTIGTDCWMVSLSTMSVQIPRVSGLTTSPFWVTVITAATITAESGFAGEAIR